MSHLSSLFGWTSTLDPTRHIRALKLLALGLTISAAGFAFLSLHLLLAPAPACTFTGASILQYLTKNGRDTRAALNDGAPHWVCAVTLPVHQTHPASFDRRELLTASVPWECWLLRKEPGNSME